MRKDTKTTFGKAILRNKTFATIPLCNRVSVPDMEFVQNFTPPDFQAKNFTPSISPNFNNLVRKNTKNE